MADPRQVSVVIPAMNEGEAVGGVVELAAAAGVPVVAVVGDDPAAQGVPMAPPDWAVRLVRAGRGLLFLDELAQAAPLVQAACLQLNMATSNVGVQEQPSVPAPAQEPENPSPKRGAA